MSGSSKKPINTMDWSALRSVALVVFIKVLDGNIREMICTTNLSLIPIWAHPMNMRQTPPYIQAAFDLEKNEWRSFYKRNVKLIIEANAS